MATGEVTRIGFPLRACLVALICLCLAGCGQGTSPTSESPDEALSPDESVLNALAPYDPVYKLNYSGRVVALKLEGNRIPAEVLEEVSKLTELSYLSLYAALLTDDSLAKLASLKNVQQLGLAATPITGKGLVHLEPLPALRELWLSKALVEPEPAPGVKSLKNAIPGLTIYPQ
jgi:hypothetical protein